MLSFLLILRSGWSMYGILSTGTAPRQQHASASEQFGIPLSCTQILVTRTAVSVVICTGPKRRPWYPFLRSSEVRSRNMSVNCTQWKNSDSITHLLVGRLLIKNQLFHHISSLDQCGCLPSIPPNKKMSKVSPSSGLKSLAAAGSSRHTLSFLSA